MFEKLLFLKHPKTFRPLKEQKIKSRNKKHRSGRKKTQEGKTECPLKCQAEFSTIRKPPAFQSCCFATNIHPLCGILAPATVHNKAATLGRAYNLATATIPGLRHKAWRNKGFPEHSQGNRKKLAVSVLGLVPSLCRTTQIQSATLQGAGDVVGG